MSFRQFITPTNVIIAAGLLAATATGYVMIPGTAILPIHWGIDGAVDRTLPRDFALLVPIGAVLLVWVVFFLVDRFVPQTKVEGGRHAVRTVLAAVTGLFLVLQCGIVATGLGIEIDMLRIISFAVAVLIIILGNVMPKTQPNSLAGLRIRSAMNDPANWQATHRLTGWLLIAGGLGLLVAGVFVPTGLWLLAAILAAVFVPMVIGTIYSLRLARRGRSA